MVRMLCFAELQEVRTAQRQWLAGPPPCGIPVADVFNPCLPERDGRGLWCVTCGLRQMLPLTA